jgi:hypothetical protein
MREVEQVRDLLQTTMHSMGDAVITTRCNALGGHPNPAIRGHPKSGQRKRSDFHCCPATETPLGNGHLLLGASVPKPLGFNAFLPEWPDPPRRSTEAAMNPLEIGFRSWSPLAGFYVATYGRILGGH